MTILEALSDYHGGAFNDYPGGHLVTSLEVTERHFVATGNLVRSKVFFGVVLRHSLHGQSVLPHSPCKTLEAHIHRGKTGIYID